MGGMNSYLTEEEGISQKVKGALDKKKEATHFK